MASIPSFEEYIYFNKTGDSTPDNIHSLGQRWHLVGSIVGPTLTHRCHLANNPNHYPTLAHDNLLSGTLTVHYLLYNVPKRDKPNLCTSLWKILLLNTDLCSTFTTIALSAPHIASNLYTSHFN